MFFQNYTLLNLLDCVLVQSYYEAKMLKMFQGLNLVCFICTIAVYLLNKSFLMHLKGMVCNFNLLVVFLI